MTPLIRNLAKYGEYHRDRRNVATHLLGVPMIVLAVEILLSRPTVAFSGWALTPAIFASTLATFWYLRLDVRFGIAMGVLLAIGAWVGLLVAQQSTAVWLGSGIGLFIVGWAFQFLGHHYEGRKPAFMDDLRGLLVGPLFVLAEVAFLLGLRRDVHAALAGASGK